MSPEVALTETPDIWRSTPAATAAFVSGKVTSTQWKPAKHLLELSRLVHSAIVTGSPRRIMVCLPPRHGKSELLSRWLPVWTLQNFPAKKIIAVSASEELATTWGRSVRNAMQDMSALGLSDVTLNESSQSANRWDTSRGGGFLALGVGSSILGFGAHVALIDDPFRSFEDGCNPRVQEAVYDWYKDTFLSRVEVGGIVILVMSRIHEKDLPGRLLADDPDGWAVVNMPAISPEGTALWPEQWPVAELREKERTMSREAFAAQYQQEPLAGTSTTGRVYKDFSRKNVRPCKYEPGIPLTVSIDFNVDGHAIIAQYRKRRNGLTHLTNRWDVDAVILEEIAMPDSSTREMAQELVARLRKYAPSSHLKITVAGDASGNQRSSRAEADAKTDWAIVKQVLSREPWLYTDYRSMRKNPSILESVEAVNVALRSGDDGERPSLYIDPSCRGVIRDLEKVVFKRDAYGNLTSVIDKTDPALTHFGDCIRYWLNNEGPNKQTFGECEYSLHV